MTTTRMEMHALAILEAAESWDWPLNYRIQASGEAITPKLLSGFIAESQVLGGTLLDQFWAVVRGCHSQFEENSAPASRMKILR